MLARITCPPTLKPSYRHPSSAGESSVLTYTIWTHTRHTHTEQRLLEGAIRLPPQQHRRSGAAPLPAQGAAGSQHRAAVGQAARREEHRLERLPRVVQVRHPGQARVLPAPHHHAQGRRGRSRPHTVRLHPLPCRDSAQVAHLCSSYSCRHARVVSMPFTLDTFSGENVRTLLCKALKSDDVKAATSSSSSSS